MERKNLGLTPLVGEVLGAQTGSLPLHMVKIIEGQHIAVTIFHLIRDLGGPIGPGAT